MSKIGFKAIVLLTKARDALEPGCNLGPQPCQHGHRYSDCQICSGAKADFERYIYELEDEIEKKS